VRITTTPAGVEYVYTVESYRDKLGRPRQRIVHSHGRLDQLAAREPGVLERLRAEAARTTADRESRRGRIAYDTAEPSDGRTGLNVGWLLVDAVMGRLGITTAARRRTRLERWRIDTAALLSLLVASRVMWPGSKLKAWERQADLFAGPRVSDLAHVYQGLDHIAAMTVELQQAAWRGLGRPDECLAQVDYDVTNYFFHIDQNDPDPQGADAPRGRASRQKGCSKERRLDPIVQMGLFLDATGLPVWYRLFDGNVPDTSTMPKAVAEFKQAFPAAGRIVVVADKAMNTRGNLGVPHERGDGWIVSQSARHDKRLRAWVLNPAGWSQTPGQAARTKSFVRRRSVPVTVNGVDGVPKLVSEKLVAHWSPDAAERDRRVRDELLAKAAKLARDESGYRSGAKRGARKYVTAETIDPDTGEIITGRDTLLTVDLDLAAEEAELDGYQIVATSETALDDQTVLDRYHELWAVEQAFRVSKTDLQTRPVHVHSRAHIEAHFAVCFLALLVTRLLERWTRQPSGQLLAALRGFEAVPCHDDVHRLCRPVLFDAVDQATGAPLDQTWATLTELRDWRRRLAAQAETTEFTTRPRPPKRRKTPSQSSNPQL
jgi:hypothetical protein